jgi:hypothetical protein
LTIWKAVYEFTKSRSGNYSPPFFCQTPTFSMIRRCIQTFRVIVRRPRILPNVELDLSRLPKGSIRFSQQECSGDLDVKMPKTNDAEIEQATQEMTNELRHDRYAQELGKLTLILHESTVSLSYSDGLSEQAQLQIA